MKGEGTKENLIVIDRLRQVVSRFVNFSEQNEGFYMRKEVTPPR